MPKRARYDGPHDAVDVHLPDGRAVTVQRDHLLPTHVDGEPVPAAIRDEMLERDDWTEVDQPPAKAAKGGDS